MTAKKPCEHGLPISCCKICMRKYNQEYRRRPEIKQREREWRREYHRRPEVKQRQRKWVRKYNRRPEIKQRHKEQGKEYHRRPEVKELDRQKIIMRGLIEHYTSELAKTNAEIKRWAVPSVFLEGKQIQIQNIINNLQIIKEHTKKLPIGIRAETTDRMLNKLLSTEGKLVSWRKPLPQNVNENVNTSMKKE